MNITISAIFPTNPKHANEKSKTPSNQKSWLVILSTNDWWTSSKVKLERITIWSNCITSEKLELFFKRTMIWMWLEEDREQGTRDYCTRSGSWENLRGKRFCSFLLRNNIPHHIIIYKHDKHLWSMPIANQSIWTSFTFTRCEVQVLCVSGGMGGKTVKHNSILPHPPMRAYTITPIWCASWLKTIGQWTLDTLWHIEF